MQPDNPKPSKLEQLHNMNPELKLKWSEQQLKIRKFIVDKDDFKWKPETLTLVAGVDLSASTVDPDVACMGLVIYNPSTKQIVYEDFIMTQISQPYIPGFLAFRQIPPLYYMFNKLKKDKPYLWPQLILVDGNGILHPNQCGLASHLGVLLDLPSIGVGKTLFYIDGLDKDTVKEKCAQTIQKAGDFYPLKGTSGKVWGAALRNTQGAKNPIFVSTGTKVSLETAIECVLLLSVFRVVEPIRLADKKSREVVENFELAGKDQLIKYEMVYLDEQQGNIKH